MLFDLIYFIACHLNSMLLSKMLQALVHSPYKSQVVTLSIELDGLSIA